MSRRYGWLVAMVLFPLMLAPRSVSSQPATVDWARTAVWPTSQAYTYVCSWGKLHAGLFNPVSQLPCFETIHKEVSFLSVFRRPGMSADVIYGLPSGVEGFERRTLFKSMDSGRSWKTIPLDISAATVMVDPTDQNLVILPANYDDGNRRYALLRSTNGGLSWASQTIPCSATVLCCGAPPQTRFLLVGSSVWAKDAFSLLVSDDHGLSWRDLSQFLPRPKGAIGGGPSPLFIADAKVLPDSAGTLAILTPSGLFAGDGQSWRPLPVALRAPLSWRDFKHLEVTPSGRLYLCARRIGAAGSVLVGEPPYNDWRDLDTTGLPPDGVFGRIFARDDVVMLLEMSSMWFRTSAMNRFLPVNSGLTRWSSLVGGMVLDGPRDGCLVATNEAYGAPTTGSSGVYIRRDPAEDWKRTRWTAGWEEISKPVCFASSPVAPNNLVTWFDGSSAGHRMRSRDGGATWEEWPAAAEIGARFQDCAFSPRDSMLVFSLEGTNIGTLFASFDGGKTCKNLSATSGVKGDDLYVDSAGRLLVSHGLEIRMTLDLWEWRKLDLSGFWFGLKIPGLPDASVLAADGSTLLVRVRVDARDSGAILRSRDDGMTWTVVKRIQGAPRELTTPICHVEWWSGRPWVWLYIRDHGSNSFVVSDDWGETWRPLSLPDVCSGYAQLDWMATSPHKPGHWLFSFAGQLLETRDGGVNYSCVLPGPEYDGNVEKRPYPRFPASSAGN